MPERKINDSVMLTMLDKGKKQVEIAEFFSVPPQAISDRAKKLRGGVVKNVVMERAAEVIDKNLNTVEQLQKINKAAHQVLDNLMGKEKIVQELATVVEKILEGNPADVKEITKLVKQIISDKNTALKACQEIRGQLSLQLDIFKTLYDLKAVAEFQKEVLTAIGEASPEVKNAIIDKLNQRRIIRRSIQFD